MKSKPKKILPVVKKQKRTVPQALVDARPLPGCVAPKAKGLTLLQTIKKQLRKRPRGQSKTYMEKVARKYVKLMEKGSFAHIKEIIDRDHGKVPQRIADADGENIKFYVNMPVDDEEGAP